MDSNATVKATPATAHRAGSAAERSWRHHVAVGTLVAAVAATYSVFSMALSYTFRTRSYDLVIFSEAVRSYAHFQPGISPIKGVHDGFGPHFSVLGDHWSPIIASLAPLYWFGNSPNMLSVAQDVLFALAIPPLWLFTRRAFGGGGKATAAAYLVSVAYALSWPIQQAVRAGFHEVAFVPVLTAVALERLAAGRLRTALIALGALFLVKEDMGLLVAGIGLYLLLARPRVVPRQRLVGAAIIAAGIADTFLAVYVLIPAFGGRSNYYWAYPTLGSDVPQAALHVLAHPVSALQLLGTPPVKIHTMLWLVGAFCFLPLLSPISLALIPLVLERMLGTSFPHWWTTNHQYNAFLAAVLVCGAVDGAARLGRWVAAARRRFASGARLPDRPGVAPSVALACAGAMCVVALAVVPRFSLGTALQGSFYHRTAQMNAAAAAAATVPSGVTVEAPSDIGPQLDARDAVLLWDYQGPRWAPWVVAEVGRHAFSFKTLAEQKQRVALLEHSGYRVAFDRKGFIVLHRSGSGAGTGPARPATG